MNISKNPKRLLLVTGLLLMTMTDLAEARSGRHSNNKHFQRDRGHHSSYRQHRSVGHRVSWLPAGYLALTFAGLHYYYHSGAYYRPAGYGYVAVRPPLGVGISILPAGYRTVHYGRNRYYVANDIFYRWDESRRNYIVVDDPDPNIQSTFVATGTPEQYVYPKQGQSGEQTSRDRYECYLWAVDQTGVEPAQGNGPGDMDNYQRAKGACLEARGYSVK